MKKRSLLQFLKFTFFSLSAGAIQISSGALFYKVFGWVYWLSYLIALALSVIWNFTLNRRFTFKSAANVPVAMLKVFGFYLVFTPVSTWLGNLAEGSGIDGMIVMLLTMLANFILEFLFCKLVVFRGQEDTRQVKA